VHTATIPPAVGRVGWVEWPATAGRRKLNVSRYSLTGLIHAPRLRERFATHFFSTDQFFADAGNGELPTYAFIEPQIVGHAHNDMHPAFSMLTPGLNFDPPSSLIAGEDLLGRVYDAIRTSSPPTSPRF